MVNSKYCKTEVPVNSNKKEIFEVINKFHVYISFNPVYFLNA